MRNYQQSYPAPSLTAAPHQHEEQFVLHCVKKPLQKRALEALSSPPTGRNSRRSKLLQKLYHGQLFDLSTLNTENVGKLSAPQLLTRLQQSGAPETCYVLSTDSSYDGTFQPIADFLPNVFGTGCGIVLSLIPGKLWYLELDEKNGRYLITK